MLDNIIKFSLNNRLVIIALAVSVLGVGAYTLVDMDVDVFPDLTAPTVTIMTEAHGMAVDEVEQLISYPIESALNGAPNIRRIRSSSALGLSIVWAEFEWGTDIYRARQIINEKLITIDAALPKDIDRPQLAPISSIMGEIMMIGLHGDTTSPMDLRTLAEWTIRPQLLAVQGVAQVIITGGGYKQYQVLASPRLMNHYRVTLDELEEAVSSASTNVSGGYYNQHGQQYTIKGEARTTDIQQIGLTPIKAVDGRSIRVQDVAKIVVEAAPKIGDASVDGEPAVLMTILKQPTANTLTLTDAIDLRLSTVASQLPSDVQIDPHVFRQSTFIQASIDNLKQTLLEGAFFVALILVIFLMNWRTTIISLLAIPISLLVTVLVLKLLGLTINTMSLGGMAIAIGSLVDDAIIDVENIFKRLRQNKQLPNGERLSTIKVVYEASSEIRQSILTATLIIIAAFVPLFFLSGMEGRLLNPLGISFIVAILTSLLVAVTVTPVLSSYLLHSSHHQQRGPSWIERLLTKQYRSVLTWIFDHTKWIIGASLVLFFVSAWMLSTLGRSFLPSFNEGALVVSVVTPPGTSLTQAGQTGRLVEEIFHEIPEVTKTARRTGRAERDEHTQGGNASEVEVLYELSDRSEEAFLEEARDLLAQVPGANITIGMPIAHRIDHMLSGTRANIAIKVFGPQLNRLFQIGNVIKTNIEQIPGVTDLSVEQQIEVPQLVIRPKRHILGKYGLSLGSLMRHIDVAYAGEQIGQIYEGQQSYDLVLRYDHAYRDDPDAIRETPISLEDGSTIPLHYVADVEVSPTPFTINREDVQRKVVISANVANRDLRSVVNDIQQEIQKSVSLPDQYYITYGGQFESESRATRLLLLTSLGALIVIFFLLYSEFKDARLASIVLLNLPLALIGGVCIVKFTSGVMTIASTIGFISLFGIAARNGILLISRYQVLRKAGHSIQHTIITGSLDRLNPILMTALTTGLALIPLALAGAKAGNEIQSPMALVILGGLFSATLLNLLVIPIVYEWMERRRTGT